MLLAITALPQVLWGNLRAILPAALSALAFITGYVLGGSTRVLFMVGRGFAYLLIALGVLYLAGLGSGLISSDAVGRTFFGITSPIPRMRYDLILGGLMGWLVPLCGIVGGAYLRRESDSRVWDFAAWCLLLALGVFVFQDRGVVIVLVASLALVVVDYRGNLMRISLRLVVPSVALLALGIVFTQSVDNLSTASRVESAQLTISAITANPSILILGAPLADFESTLDASITTVDQPQGAPLHGGWLRFILEGGLARLALMLSLLAAPILIAHRTMKVRGDPASSFALSAAVATACAIGLQLVTDSPSNNAWALWLTIGCVWGLVLGESGLQRRRPGLPDPQRGPPRIGKVTGIPTQARGSRVNS
jgi:hypothetical protein